MTIKKRTLLVCAILFLLILSFMCLDYKQGREESRRELSKESKEESVISDPLDTKLCFSRNQVATSEAPYAVTEYIELEHEGQNFVGIKRGTQAGPGMTNGYEGTLNGGESEGVITLIFAYVIEGSAQSEQEIYQIENENLVKLRYPLFESGNILVPDKTQTPQKIVYQKSECRL